MSAIVDFDYYFTVYMGSETDAVNFPPLCARAEDVIGSMTRWRVSADNIATLPAQTQTLYKKAICAQVDFFALNGLDSVAGLSGVGFTVGKVSVNNGARRENSGAMSAYISPMALMYLEQSGLMNPQVDTLAEPWVGWCLPC